MGKLTAWSPASWAKPAPSWPGVYLTLPGGGGAKTGGSDFQEGGKLSLPQD